MDSQPIQPNSTKHSNIPRFALLGSIVLIAVLSVGLAIALPRRSTDDRSKAATAGVCAGKVTVAASTCNGKCGVDSDCMSGMICYKIGEALEGLCRNPSAPTSTTCSGTVATATPTAACTKACTFNYDCNLSAGEQCVGTNSNNTAVNIVSNAPRAATTTELATLAADQTIFMAPGSDFKPDSSGKMPFSIVSKKATTFVVYIFDITAAKGALDPQKLLLKKSISIGANQVVTGTVTLPRCGRYQVDYGSAIVTGTKYDANPAAHYFWGTVFEIPCQSGCCQLPTAAAPASVSSPVDLVRLSLVSPTTGTGIAGYTSLPSTVTITRASVAPFTIAAVSFPNAFPPGVGSVKFEANGATQKIDNTEPYQLSDVAITSAGVFTLKTTLYSGENATGTVIDTMTSAITIK